MRKSNKSKGLLPTAVVYLKRFLGTVPGHHWKDLFHDKRLYSEKGKTLKLAVVLSVNPTT